MAQQPTPEARTAVEAPENENSTVTVALAMGTDDSHDAVQHGAPVADHASADDSLLVAGTVATTYSDERYLLETENGYRLVVTPEEVRDFDTSETLGRPVYQAEDEPEATHDGEATTELGASVEELTSGLTSDDEDEAEAEQEQPEQEQPEQEQADEQAEWGAPKNSRQAFDHTEGKVAVEVLMEGGQVFEAWASDGGEDGMCTYATLYVPEVRFMDTARSGEARTGETSAWLEVAEFKASGQYSVQERSPHLAQERYNVFTSGLGGGVEAVRPAQE